MPTKEQKQLIEQHVSHLDRIFLMTPEEESHHGNLTMVTITKMLLALPAKESTDLATEAKGEAYMLALEDVPNWAVQEAMRRWYRSECGPKYDYKWQPGPATLREVAMMEVYRVMGTRRKLREILSAEPLQDFSQDHMDGMKERLSKPPRLKSMGDLH